MSIDESDALAMEEAEAPTEEDLSDEAVEGNDPERSPGDSAVDAPVTPPMEALFVDAGPDGPGLDPDHFQTPEGDTFDAESGEVLKDAPGWDKTTRRIQNVVGLDWTGEKLSETTAAIQENERLRDAAVERLQRRIDLLKARTTDINSPLVMRQEFFETAIRAYADAHRTDILRGQRKDSKSRRFPSGLRLAWKSGGGGYRWDTSRPATEREAALLEWAEHEETVTGETLTRAVLRPDVDAIKAHLEALDAEERAESLGLHNAAPPGLEYVPEHEELSVKVEGDDK